MEKNNWGQGTAWALVCRIWIAIPGFCWKRWQLSFTERSVILSWSWTVPLKCIPPAEGIVTDRLVSWTTGPGLLNSCTVITTIITAAVTHKEMNVCLFVKKKNIFPSDQQVSWISNNQRVSSGSTACCKVKFIMLKQQLLAAFFLISYISEVQRPIPHFTVTFNKN